MTAPSLTIVTYQPVDSPNDRRPENTDHCIVCDKSNWHHHPRNFCYPGKVGDQYVHKCCVIICEWFDLTVQNMKFLSTLSKERSPQRFNSILLAMQYIDARSNRIDVFNTNYVRRIEDDLQNIHTKDFNNFVQVVQSVFDEIVQFSPSSSSSSSNCDTVDSKDDDGDADMAPASNSSSSPTGDSVQGYSDDDNDVDDLDSNNAFPDVTGLYGVDAFMLM